MNRSLHTISLFAFLWPTLGWGALQVLPTRVILTDEARVGALTLHHTGERAGHYKVSAVFFRTKADGTSELVTDARPDERPLMKYIHFSPRHVTVQPNQEQVVRVLFSGPKSLPDGEYRAHLNFMPEEGDETTPAGTRKEGNITMRLEARIAIAVPIIYRHGKTQLAVTLNDLSLVKIPADKATNFSVVLQSVGNAFPYGDFLAFFTPKNGGETKEVGVIRGASSYSGRRLFSFPLAPPSGVDLKNGTLKLEFRESVEPGAEGAKVLATAEIGLP